MVFFLSVLKFIHTFVSSLGGLRLANEQKSKLN